jgi:hypothetical protein
MSKLDWLNVNLHGAVKIERVCGVYDIRDLLRVPDGHYKIKVMQHSADYFFASPNICVRSSDGAPDWVGGAGSTEIEALQDALKEFGESLDSLGGSLERERFEWADPTEF